MTTMAAGKQLNHILVFKGMPEGHIANKILPYIHVDVSGGFCAFFYCKILTGAT